MKAHLGILLLMFVSRSVFAQQPQSLPESQPTSATTCGDKALDSGEACDDGNTKNNDGCSSTCQNEASPVGCGDYTIQGTETCDDGNTQSGDGCSSFCLDEDGAATCGNSILESGEQCDDGNALEADQR